MSVARPQAEAAASDRPKRSKWKRRLRWLLAALGLFLIWLAWVFVAAYWDRAAAYAALRERGEFTDYAEYARATMAAMPKGPTGAEYLRAAQTELGIAPGGHSPGPVLGPVEKWLETWPAPAVHTPLQAALQKGKPALLLLANAVSMPPGYVNPYILDEPMGQPPRYEIVADRDFYLLLCGEAIDALAANEPRRAYAAVRTALALPRQWSVDPAMDSPARQTHGETAVRLLAYVLGFAAPTVAEAKAIDDELGASFRDFAMAPGRRMGQLLFLRGLSSPESAPRLMGAALRHHQARNKRQGKPPSPLWDNLLIARFQLQAWTMRTPLGLPSAWRAQAAVASAAPLNLDHLDDPNDVAAIVAALDALGERSWFPITQNPGMTAGENFAFLRSVGVKHRQRLLLARVGLRTATKARAGKIPAGPDVGDAALTAAVKTWMPIGPVYERRADGFLLAATPADVAPTPDDNGLPPARFEVRFAKR